MEVNDFLLHLKNISLQNNPELVVRALEIEAGMWKSAPDYVPANVDRREATDEIIKDLFQERTYTVTLLVPVLKVDPYRMHDPYFVQLPNGHKAWRAKSDNAVCKPAKGA